MYYQCSENKGADQLRGYLEADLRLCFCICQKLVFSQRGSNIKISSFESNENTQRLFVNCLVYRGHISLEIMASVDMLEVLSAYEVYEITLICSYCK